MSEPFFSDRINDLHAAALRWDGTPFHAHACIRGAGVDCVHLCAAIYIECGFLERFDPPKYALDGGKHAPESLVIQWVKKSGRFEQVESVRPGDLICFRTHKHSWHVGIYLGPHARPFPDAFIHAVDGAGVIIQPLGAMRLAAIYRPLECREVVTT